MKHRQKQLNGIYQVGIADAFINGLYKGTLAVGTLKSRGDYGIGALNLVDGELTFYNGKVYQTRWNGLSTEAPDSLTTPFAFVSFFEPETTFHINGFTGKGAILEQVEKYLRNKNGMYAIRISGKFHPVKTRAFPPVTREPFCPWPICLTNSFSLISIIPKVY